MIREGGTLTILEDKAYLIGGRGLNFHPDIYCFMIGCFFNNYKRTFGNKGKNKKF